MKALRTFLTMAALLSLAVAYADNKTTKPQPPPAKPRIVVPPEVRRPQPPTVNPNKPVVPDKPKKEWPHGKSADRIYVPSPKVTKTTKTQGQQ